VLRRVRGGFDYSTEERVRTLIFAATAILLAGGVGCRKKPAPVDSDPAPAVPGAPAPSAPVAPKVARKANPVTVPTGWAEYAPPEKDFSVVAPGAPRAEVVPQRADTVRTYTFRSGTTVLRVFVSERAGARPQWAEPDAARNAPDIVRGSLKELPARAGLARGLELRRTDPRDGAMLVQAWWPTGSTTDIGLHVLKPDSVPAEHARAFLDSFAYHGR
jgi:hypothetical protein